MSYIYKNTSDRAQVLINIGVVEAGETIKVTDQIFNPNFELVAEETQQEQQSVQSVEQPQPNVITEAQPLNNNEPQGDQQ